MIRPKPSSELIRRRHPEWQEHHLRWRWMLDSLEGGQRYRQAVYGYDGRGLPIRNLVRHKREYPDPRELVGPVVGPVGIDPAATATDDDYELRRSRTPVPTFVAESVETHLARIYAREVRRAGPEGLVAWWADVDGTGTTIDDWMTESIAPLLLTLGQLDILMDHPPIPEGEAVETRADVERLGLDRCVATYILPEDMLWWRLDETGRRYEECLVLEATEGPDGVALSYRHWTDSASSLYGPDGTLIATTQHAFGRVPIVRVFDARKPRCRNIGQSRYEGVAERQREYYNRDSELILSDTTQAHPLLQGPEDYVQADGTIPVGPSWLLPKKKNTQGGSATYEGFSVVDFPKHGAESIRQNKADLRDDIDRDAALVSPTGRGGQAQSGLAKMVDHTDGNNRLAKVAKALGRAERSMAGLALVVLGNGPPIEGEPVEVNYPADFDLYTAMDVAEASTEFQDLLAKAGTLPTVEGHMLMRLMRLCLPGLSDPQYAACDAEIAAVLEARASRSAVEVSAVTITDTHRW